MSDNWTSWGTQPNQAMRHQPDKEECPYCGHREERFSFFEYMVGFSDKADYRSSMYEDDRAGMARSWSAQTVSL